MDKSVLDSLFSPAISSALIKGEPGGGKTTLALELLRRHGTGLYISTRVSQEKLLDQQQSFKPLLEQNKTQEDLLDGVYSYTFEDQRFGNATDIVSTLAEKVSAANSKRGEQIIVLDSWDSIAKELDKMERFKVERSLLLMAEAKRAKVLFMSEEPSLTTTDYLVDAIIVLKDDTLDGRRIRRMEIKKLRGSAIPQRSYAYTLDQNTFFVLESSKILYLSKSESKPYRAIPHRGEILSSGSEDLNDFLGGGMRKGSALLLEISQEMGSDGHFPIASSLRNNFIANGGSAVVVLSGGITPEMAYNSAKNFIPAKEVEKRFRIGSFEEYRPGVCFFRLNSYSISKAFEVFWKQVEIMKRKYKEPCLIFLAAERLEFMFGHEDLPKWIIRSVQKVKRSGDLLAITVRASTKSKSDLSDLCDFHLKLGVADGASILYSIKPASQLYHISYEYDKGLVEIKMKPIV
jgi:KaiC/GvpD/RAD55 family RecA-like ATPase